VFLPLAELENPYDRVGEAEVSPANGSISIWKGIDMRSANLYNKTLAEPHETSCWGEPVKGGRE
jgi:hypothetical protein